MQATRAAMAAVAAVAVMFNGSAAHAGASDAGVLVIYATHRSAPPTLRCQPPRISKLTGCAIFLPPGEHLNPAKIVGDAARWELDPEVFGPDGRNAVVYVKEKSDVAGIVTNVYLMTDAVDGIYRVLVVSDPRAPTFSEIHFSHPQTLAEKRAAAAAAQRAAERAQRDRVQAAHIAAVADATAAAAVQQRAANRRALAEIDGHPCTVRANDHYRWDVKSPLAPLAVFLDDETHTCVQFPAGTAQLPLPYVGDAPARMHPLRRSDNMMIIDGMHGSFELRAGAQSLKVEYRP